MQGPRGTRREPRGRSPNPIHGSAAPRRRAALVLGPGARTVRRHQDGRAAQDRGGRLGRGRVQGVEPSHQADNGRRRRTRRTRTDARRSRPFVRAGCGAGEGRAPIPSTAALAQGTRRAGRGGGGGAADGDRARAGLPRRRRSHGDLRDTPDDDDDSYDDDDDDETETTAAVAGTNLTREILHESPHYRQLVEHYRRRMGEPGYDPDASDDEDDPIRDSLVAATVAETVGSHEAARRRGGSSSHTSGARRFVAVMGHDGAHGLVTATRASRGAEANVAARAAVAAREVYAAAGLPYPTRSREGLGFREAHRFAGVPYPDEFPTNVDSVRSEDDRGVGRLLAGRLVERERLAREAARTTRTTTRTTRRSRLRRLPSPRRSTRRALGRWASATCAPR